MVRTDTHRSFFVSDTPETREHIADFFIGLFARIGPHYPGTGATVIGMLLQLQHESSVDCVLKHSVLQMFFRMHDRPFYMSAEILAHKYCGTVSLAYPPASACTNTDVVRV